MFALRITDDKKNTFFAIDGTVFFSIFLKGKQTKEERFSKANEVGPGSGAHIIRI